MFTCDDSRATICFIPLLTLTFLSLQAIALTNSNDEVPSTSRNLQFKHLTIDDGLSQGMVNAIYQDHQGFMWFGTKAGLNRYDGYRFTIFRNNPFDSTSLTNNYITTIFEDRQGRLWIGTEDGLNCFDPATEKFRRFLHNPNQTYSLSDNNISAICEAPAPTNEAKSITVLWIGTVNGGLNKLVLRENDAAPWELPPAMQRWQSHRERQAANVHQSETSQQTDHYFVRYQHNPDDPKSLSSNRVWDLLVHQSGVLWIATNQGLCCFDPPHASSADDDQSVNFTRDVHNAEETASLLDNECHSLYETRDGSIWIGTAKGLARMTPASGLSGGFENHEYPAGFLLSADRNSIHEICEDRRGVLWLVTYQGLLVFDPKKATYQWVRHDVGDPASLSYDGVCSIFRDRSGAIWIGTAGFGLNRWDPLGKAFHAYTPEKLALNSDTGLSIYALLEDRRGLVWIFANHDWYQFNRQTGSFTRHPLNFVPEEVNALYEDHAGFLWITNNAGISRYDPRSGRIKKIYPPRDEPKFELHAIYEDNTGDMWFGSVSALSKNPVTSLAGRHALYCWNRTTKRVTAYPILIPETIKGDWLGITRLVQDRSGIFWLATNWGLLRFHPQSGALKIFQNEPGNRNSLTNNEVKTLIADPLRPERCLWLGTNGGGLNCFDIATESFSHYMEAQGLPNDVVYGILSDNAGNLWMSTNNGLSKAQVAPVTREILKFTNYDVGDGLQSNEFNTNAYFKSARGEMFFGGIKGFNVFHPDSIKENSRVPPVVFTDFQIRYQSVEPGPPGSPLRKTINTTETITLSPKDNVLAIEFAALDYSASGKNLYSYKLENFDEDWSQPRPNRRATYTNLKPGKYTLHVRGSNSDGVWNKTGARLAIEIKPYFYQTGWFAVLCTLALGLTVYGGHRWRLRYLELKHRELEKLVAERTRQLHNSEDMLRQLNEHLEQRVLERTAALQDSENRYHALFDEAPTPLWEIDMSEVKNLLAQWQETGVASLRAFLDEHPEAVAQCLALIKTLNINQATRRLYQAKSKEQLIFSARQIWNAASMRAFKEQLAAIAEGKIDNEFETNAQTLAGKQINIWVHWHVVPGYEKSLSRIFIATIDITERMETLDELQASRERFRALSAHLQTLREQERVAIARDLHDELGQALTALKMDMSMLERKAKSANGKINCVAVLSDIETMQERIAGTIKFVRSLITELRPEILDALGLVPALEWQIEEFHKRTGLAYEFHSEVEELNLNRDQAIALYRIFQESLTNIARHAEASQVKAKIAKRDRALWIEIADNGKGISAEALNVTSKFGVLGMRERALVFGGEVSIIGTPGRGTTVKIKVPISSGEHV